jgi:carotenoid 1,2-hydratase
VTIIALIGSVFSPYYASARRRGPAPAEAFCALNVVFYGPGNKHWAMTERGAGDLARTPDQLQIGPSSLHWENGALVIDICEVTVPWPRRIRGRVTLYPQSAQPTAFALDGAGRHRWWPAAPVARVEVSMQKPALSWQGPGYFDCNWGDEPLEDCFTSWNWSRSHLADGSTAVLYEPIETNGDTRLLAWQFHPDGGHSALPVGPVSNLPRTAVWRIERCSRAALQTAPTVIKTLEDTPFYARTLLATELLGESTVAVHESLSLDRFRRRWVQHLLPFRMPRRGRPSGTGSGLDD